APQRDPVKHASLPFASSLCGSCSDVCPVKIDLHHQLLAFRKELVDRNAVPLGKRLAMGALGFVLARPLLYRARGGLVRALKPRLPGWAVSGGWTRQRELPVMPKRSFRDLLRKEIS